MSIPRNCMMIRKSVSKLINRSGESHEARKMTDNELWASLYKKYGRDFDPKALPEDDPLVMEFWDRVSRGFSL